MTKGEIARLALGTELVADKLWKRAKACEGPILYVTADEMSGIAKRLADCSDALKEIHTAMTPKEAA